MLVKGIGKDKEWLETGRKKQARFQEDRPWLSEKIPPRPGNSLMVLSKR